MNTPIWVVELAARFWAAAGSVPPFPRDLTEPAIDALALRVVALKGLRLDSVRTWLVRARVTFPITEPDRPLRACLATWGHGGFVFLDTSDSPEEQRFSVAHEVSHFLRDYDAVRRAVLRRLGPAGLEVLDGKRPATFDERLQAVLRGVPVAAHIHLLRRSEEGRPASEAEREAEESADRLAFELLAPAELFNGMSDSTVVKKRLETEFGLPSGPAAAYAAILCPPVEIDPIVQRLKKFR